MNSNGASGDDTLERIRDIPRIQAAIREGVREALWRHKRLGESIVVWRDGKVVVLPPEEIPVDETAGSCTYGANGLADD